MILPITYRPAATKDFEDSSDWYELSRIGLGDEFEAEIDAALNLIRTHPNRFPVVRRDVREAPVNRFPFSILYRVRSGRIFVISVFHNARDPAEWQGRV